MSKDDSQPVYIMPEGTQRNSGKSAQRMNILAGKLVAETVRTTLGPKGMDKMLVDTLGEVIVTNDGVTILKEMNVEHPTAKMMVEVAKTQDSEVGDGTTTAVVVAGELLRKAEELLDKNIHPTVIAKGYRMAAEKSMSVLSSLSTTVKPSDVDVLMKIAETAMTGKGAEDSRHYLAKTVVEAIKSVTQESGGKAKVYRSDIRLEKKTGSGLEKTELIKGIVLDKEKVHSGMPDEVKNANIALIDSALEVRSPETEAKISITDPDKIQGFLDMEEKMLKTMVEKIKAAGANVVVCQKGIDDLAQHFLSKAGIFAIRRVKKSDMEQISKATGGRLVSDLKDLSKEDLGFAGVVNQQKVGDDYMVYIVECRKPKAVTLLVRGSTPHVTDEIARALEDAVGDVAAALENGHAVSGAGAVEMELSKELKAYADTLSGREQLAVGAFAEALEVIPVTLSENAGLDPIDTLAELKSAHGSGNKNAGINVFTGKLMDSWKEGVIEPLKVKTQAITSATEVAVLILRIDDIILAEKGFKGTSVNNDS